MRIIALLFLCAFSAMANPQPIQHSRWTTNTDAASINGATLTNVQWAGITGFTNTSFVLATNGTARGLIATNMIAQNYGGWVIKTNSSGDLEFNNGGAIITFDNADGNGNGTFTGNFLVQGTVTFPGLASGYLFTGNDGLLDLVSASNYTNFFARQLTVYSNSFFNSKAWFTNQISIATEPTSPTDGATLKTVTNQVYTLAATTNLMSQKGDMLIWNGTNYVRQPVSTNGFVNVYDSTTTTGMRAVANTPTAAGSSKNIQFNNAGSTSGDNLFDWDFSIASFVLGNTNSPTVVQQLFKRAASAASSILGYTGYRGTNTIGGEIEYASIRGSIVSGTASSEGGKISLYAIGGGVNREGLIVTADGIYTPTITITNGGNSVSITTNRFNFSDGTYLQSDVAGGNGLTYSGSYHVLGAISSDGGNISSDGDGNLTVSGNINGNLNPSFTNYNKLLLGNDTAETNTQQQLIIETTNGVVTIYGQSSVVDPHAIAPVISFKTAGDATGTRFFQDLDLTSVSINSANSISAVGDFNSSGGNFTGNNFYARNTLTLIGNTSISYPSQAFDDSILIANATEGTIYNFQSGMSNQYFLLATCGATNAAGQTITNSNTETSMFSTGWGTRTLPTNYFRPGRKLEINLAGVYWTPIANTTTLAVQVKYGGVVCASNSLPAFPTSQVAAGWDLKATLTCCSVSGTNGTFMITGDVGYDVVISGVTVRGKADLNNDGATFTAPINLSTNINVTGTFSAATSGLSIKTINAGMNFIH